MKALSSSALILALVAPAAADRTCSLPPGACDEPIVMARPHPLWQPLTVLGGGVVLVGVGALLQLDANATMRDYNAAIGQACAEGGCTPEDVPAHITALEDSAILKNRLAVTTIVIGGIAAIAGLVWTLLDYPRPVRAQVTRDTVSAELRF